MAALPRAAAGLLPALAEAAERTGVDFEALVRTARLESGFNPAARARTSSATGLFQFIESTWLDVLARHGPRHGIAAASRSAALALRSDASVSALMAAEHMAENRGRLESALGRAVRPLDLYLAHFLGPGGALDLLRGLAADPSQPAAERMPAAARANRAIFYAKSGAARSLADVHALIARRFGAPGTETGATASAAQPAPAVQAAQAGRPAQAVAPSATPDAARPLPPAAARAAAQAAYLLLADLGG